MEDKFNLERFVEAQDTEPFGNYEQALAEMLAGQKRGHWIWYIFPQMRGLGHSPNSYLYGISGLAEAKAYLAHEVLGPRLREITEAVLEQAGEPVDVLMGWEVDSMKLKSSMTLFDAASPDDKQYFFEGLASGEHTAGVIASYTSGDTEMSTITFSVEGPDNIETLRTESVEAPAYDIYGRRVDAANTRGVFIQKGEKIIK